MAGEVSQRSSNTKIYFLSFDREVELHRYGILGGLIKGLKTSQLFLITYAYLVIPFVFCGFRNP